MILLGTLGFYKSHDSRTVKMNHACLYDILKMAKRSQAAGLIAWLSDSLVTYLKKKLPIHCLRLSALLAAELHPPANENFITNLSVN